MPLRTSLRLALTLTAVAAAASPALAQGPAPTLTVKDQTVSFVSPLAMLDEQTSAVSLLFASRAPSAAAEAKARAAGAWAGLLAEAGPAVVVDFGFTPGSVSGLVGQLTACAITAYGFRAPLALAGGASACHIVSVGGMLKSPGGMAGLIEGTAAGYAMRLPFAVSFGDAVTSASPSVTPAAPASAPAAVGASAGTGPAPALPLDTAKGAGTYQGQTVTVTHGLAWWAAGQKQLRIALFNRAPGAGVLAAARKGEFDGDDAPVATVYVGFPGAGRDLASADYCFVNVTFPKGGPIGVNTSPKDCGLTTLATSGQPGGAVHAVLKGSGAAPVGRFSWDLEFHLPIAK